MKLLNKGRSSLYKSARILGDINSLSSPKKFVKRQLRKSAYRNIFGFIGKLLK